MTLSSTPIKALQYKDCTLIENSGCKEFCQNLSLFYDNEPFSSDVTVRGSLFISP